MRAGVIGWPVAHSLSPAIHGAWLRALGMNGAYEAVPAEPGRFAETVQRLRAEGWRGANVTAPYKLEALASADRRDRSAERAESANLLLFDADGVEARSTDGVGVIEALRLRAPDAVEPGGTAVLVGAGGAARAAAAVLVDAGLRLRVVNRTADGAQALADASGGEAYPMADAATALAGASLCVVCAPLDEGAAATLPWAALEARAAVLDMVYVPLETPALAAARAAGLRPIDGLDMLVGQAKPTFEALFGVAPPEQVSGREAAMAELARR